MTETLTWAEAIAGAHQNCEGFVLATVLEVKGSTPRDRGAKMVITRLGAFDTIGGGRLEQLVIESARASLALNVKSQHLEHFPLAGKAQQCCGGSVAVLLEVFPAARLPVTIFGAGHIGRALVDVLTQCDSRIQWVDSRAERLPEIRAGNVTPIVREVPESIVETLNSNERVIIVTHDHALDLRLLSRLLDETSIQSIGLIGSATKAARFKTQLRALGIPASEDHRWCCPVGLESVRGKLPMEVAVSIAAQLLSELGEDQDVAGPSWRDVQRALGKIEFTGSGNES